MQIPLQNKASDIEVSQTVPEKYTFGFDLFLYNFPAHLRLQPSLNLRSFFLLHPARKQVLAQLSVFVEGGVAFSPLKGHFGSVQCAAKLPPGLACFFIAEVLSVLQAEKLVSVELVHYPACYAPEETSLLTHTFLAAGFRVKSSQINHHIPVSDKPFAGGLHLSARRRLSKCHRNNFSFRQLPVSWLNQVYAFIQACRQERGTGLSLPLQEIQTLFRDFPENYFLFAVLDGENPVAATVAVKVNNRVLYNFYPASPLSLNKESPVVMLNEGLYDFCRQKNFPVLDLGISARPGEEHFSLMEFKARLGGIISNKFIFEYIFPA